VSTVAYVFLLVGALIVRQVYKGRVMNIGEDLTDAFIALTTGNTSQLTAVLTRTGDANSAPEATLGANAVGGTGAVAAAIAVGQASGIVAAAKKRGSAAKGYRWAATGPDYYDCSGLMWRASQDCGFTGARFTTATIQLSKQFQQVAAPATQGPTVAGREAATIGDIIVWPGHHMGVITGPNKFYSARNPRSGISEAPIEGFRPGNRTYYRLKV
jgi:cell wall-associated NlpC family hydrolase